MSRTTAAWFEIVEQILGEFHTVDNATPDWLVDPESGRRLKLDKLYPELGIAIRFKGLLGASRSRDVDKVELTDELIHDEIRARLCHEAGIALVVVDTDSDAPGRALAEMHTALSAAARRIAQRRVAREAKSALLPRVALAKTACRRIMNAVSSPQDLLPFAQAWEDRQFGEEGK